MAKKTVELNSMNVTFTCSEAGKQTVYVSEHDFMSLNQECELCGSHGNITVDVKCACGETHSIEIKSW